MWRNPGVAHRMPSECHTYTHTHSAAYDTAACITRKQNRNRTRANALPAWNSPFVHVHTGGVRYSLVVRNQWQSNAAKLSTDGPTIKQSHVRVFRRRHAVRYMNTRWRFRETNLSMHIHICVCVYMLFICS